MSTWIVRVKVESDPSGQIPDHINVNKIMVVRVDAPGKAEAIARANTELDKCGIKCWSLHQAYAEAS